MARGSGRRPPFWLLALFPNLHGLERNPIYVRLSGRGCGPGFLRRLWRTPPELRPGLGERSLIGRIGLLPFFLMLIMPALVLIPTVLGDFLLAFLAGLGWQSGLAQGIKFSSVKILYMSVGGGAFLLFVRLAQGQIWRRMRTFFRRAMEEPWGELLSLTRLNTADWNQGTFAALLEREVRTNALCVGIAVAAGLLATRRVSFAARMVEGLGGSTTFFALGMGAVAWIELCALTMLGLTDMLKDPLVFMRPTNIAPEEGVWNKFIFEASLRWALAREQWGRNGALIARTHWVGLIVFFIWMMGTGVINLEGSALKPFFYLAGAGLFALINFQSALQLARRRLKIVDQSPGRLLRQALRDR